MMKAEQFQDAGEMIRRGELLVADGKAIEARGEETKRQGNNLEGDRLVGEGKARQKQGQELIDHGRQIRGKNY